jgi:hypothetical protein
LAALSDGKLKTHRELFRATGLSEAAVWSALARAWLDGMSRTTRAFHRYLLATKCEKGSGSAIKNSFHFQSTPGCLRGGKKSKRE